MDLRKRAQEELRQLTAEIDQRIMARDVLLRVLGDGDAPETTKAKRVYKKRTVVAEPTKADMPMPLRGRLNSQEVLDVITDCGKEGAIRNDVVTLVNVRRPIDKILKSSVQTVLKKLYDAGIISREQEVKEGSWQRVYRYFLSGEQKPKGTYTKTITTSAPFDKKIIEKLIKKSKTGVTYAEVLSLLEKKGIEDVNRSLVGRYLKELSKKPSNIKKRKSGKHNNFGNAIFQYYWKETPGALV